MSAQKITECLACTSSSLRPLLNLGEQPLANSYKNEQHASEEKYPLATNVCQDCFHVQLTHAVNPDLLFKNYLYVSGTSQTMKDYFKWFAEYTLEYFTLLNMVKPSRILDIGCNDGSQLDVYKMKGFKTFGVDPAQNLYKKSSVNHTVYPEYFNLAFLSKEESYDIIVAQNVFAHNSNPSEFLNVAKECMFNDSLLFIQTSQADMILNNEFDTIYSEHINFFNVQSMETLIRRVGMYLVDVIKTPLHGNSYLFVISKNKQHARKKNIENIITMEDKAGLYSMKTYDEYVEKCKTVIFELSDIIKNDGTKIFVGYGAAAKGMTVLNATGIDYTHMKCIIDDNPLKQGKFAPGSSIPIHSQHWLNDYTNTDLVFVPLAWNMFTEIHGKIKKLRPNNNDMFLSYFPKVRYAR